MPPLSLENHHWGEVFPLLMAGSKVLVLLLLLHLGKTLLGLGISIGMLIGISDSEKSKMQSWPCCQNPPMLHHLSRQ